jgi:hypothetical protein
MVVRWCLRDAVRTTGASESRDVGATVAPRHSLT